MSQDREIDHLRKEVEISNNKYSNLLWFNRKMYDDNSDLIQTLERYKDSIEDEDFREKIRLQRDFYEDLDQKKQQIYMHSPQGKEI